MSSKPTLATSEGMLAAFRLDAEFSEEATLQKVQYPHKDFKETQKWENTRYLGGGVFGQVRQERLVDANGDWQYRAVKVCSKRRLRHTGVDYTREISALAALSSSKHSGLFVNLIGWWTDPINLYIAMEYVSRGDLSAYVGQGLSEVDAREISADVANGLHIMHQEGFTHRDLKPQNILVVQRRPEFYKWHVKIADFGVSKRILEDANTDLHTLLGTRPYTAPEILGYLSPAQHSSIYTNKVDLWSLGCVLFTIGARGALPFSEPDLVRYCDGLAQFTPQMSCSSFGEQAISLLNALLQLLPERRPSAAEVLDHEWFHMIPNMLQSKASEAQASPQMQQLPIIAKSKDQRNYNSFLKGTRLSDIIFNKGSSWRRPEKSPATHAAPSSNTEDEQHIVDMQQGIVHATDNALLSCRTEFPIHSGNDLCNVIFSRNNEIVVYEAGQFFKRTPGHEPSLRYTTYSTMIKALRFSQKAHWGQHFFSLSAKSDLHHDFDLGRVITLWNQLISWNVWDIDIIPGTLFDDHLDPIGYFQFLSNGTVLATTQMDHSITLWHAKGKGHSFVGHTSLVNSMAISPDNKVLVSSSNDKTIRVWDLREGALKHILAQQDSAARSVAFFPTGLKFLSGSAGGIIYSCSTANATTLEPFFTVTGCSVNVITFSPDRLWIAAGYSDCNIKLFENTTRKLVCKLQGHDYGVATLAFSPVGKTMAAGSFDYKVRLWDISFLREISQQNRRVH